MTKASRGARSIMAAMACLVALSGCQTMVREDWNPEPTLPPLESVHVEVPESQLRARCGNHPGMLLHGCARRDYIAQVCVIYTAPRPPEWLLEHERKHCAGWDHGAMTAPLVR